MCFTLFNIQNPFILKEPEAKSKRLRHLCKVKQLIGAGSGTESGSLGFALFILSHHAISHEER